MPRRKQKKEEIIKTGLNEEERDARRSKPGKNDSGVKTSLRDSFASDADRPEEDDAELPVLESEENGEETAYTGELEEDKSIGLDESEIDGEEIYLDLPAVEGSAEKETAGKLKETEGKSLAPFDPLRRYLWEIKHYPILSREEEHRLALEYRKTGDRKIAIILITSNLRLVVKIALEFQKHWMLSLLDLIQEGNVGLMHAVKKFDPYRGTRLSSYSSFWIKAYILKFIIENWRLVKIGTTQSQRKLFFNLRKEKDRLDSLGFNPGPKLLAQRLDVKESEVIEMGQRLNGWELSLDTPVHDESQTKHKDLLTISTEPVDDQLAEMELKDILHRKLNDFKESLPERDQFIYQHRLVAEQPLTLQEIGDEFGITRERARQIEERIKKRLKEYLENEMPELAELIDERLH